MCPFEESFQYRSINEALHPKEGCRINESPRLEHLLRLKPTSDLKWNSYIRSIVKYT